MTTHTMYQIYDPRNRMYLGFADTPDYSNWLWCRDKKKAYNFDTLRDVYEQLLQIPYYGTGAEDDPVNYCKIVRVQVSDPIRSLELAKNDLKAVGAIDIEVESELDKLAKGIFNRHSGGFESSLISLLDKRNYFADRLRANILDISEEEVNHYVHKHLPERNA